MSERELVDVCVDVTQRWHFRVTPAYARKLERWFARSNTVRLPDIPKEEVWAQAGITTSEHLEGSILKKLTHAERRPYVVITEQQQAS